jgi:hypothetical protein
MTKTLHPGGIRTRDLLFCRRTRWPSCHAARAKVRSTEPLAPQSWRRHFFDRQQLNLPILQFTIEFTHWIDPCFRLSSIKNAFKQLTDVQGNQGSMLWSQFSAIFAIFRRQIWLFSQKPLLWAHVYFWQKSKQKKLMHYFDKIGSGLFTYILGDWKKSSGHPADGLS